MRKYRVIIYPKYDLELTWLVSKSHFDTDLPEYRTCMRCGQKMQYPLAQNALSRAMDVYVCSDCGMDEAIRDATGEILPVSEWYIVKHHYFGEHEPINTSRLLRGCRFQNIFSGPKKTLPLNSVLYPASLIAYSRSDYDGYQWWTTWFHGQEEKALPEVAYEMDAFMDALFALPEFKTLRSMKRTCKLYAEPTAEQTEYNLYSETEHLYIWLRLITRERDYNLYVYFYDRNAT
ncbi:hypothetical protein [Flintibacter sp.]|uniref:hypothetical protein n=1 Tax=Flintibacter sp. TaxID=1918624 RepID=UPI003A3A3E28